jgi:hypothetical protein
MSAVRMIKYLVRRCIGLLVLLVLVAVLVAAQQKKPAAQAPKPAPAAKTSAPHTAAPAQHQAQAPNRGPAGNTSHPGGPGQNNNRAVGPGGQHSVTGPQANKMGSNGQAGKPGTANQPNKGGMVNQGNKGGQGGRPGTVNQGNKVGQGGRPGMNNQANKGGPGAKNAHPQPQRTTAKVGGHEVAKDSRGKVRDIKSAHGVNIHRDLRGGRKVEKTYPGGRKVVATGKNSGYMQRPYVNRNGTAYVQRTYVVNGVSYTRVYGTYYYGGYPYYGYAPAYYYNPGYYGWAYNPWPAPVYYNWGWNAYPWYGPYGYYYSPAPYYPASSLWLTDYLMAENMRLAYEAAAASGKLEDNPYHVDQNAYAALGTLPAGAAKDSPAQFPTELKNELADEVKAQIAEDKAAAEKSGASGTAKPGAAGAAKSGDQVPPALDPKRTLFVVSSSIDVTTDDDQECELTAGDVIKRLEDTPSEDKDVQVEVKSSKKDDCKVGSKPRVLVSDLQEMHNQFREQLDAGLKKLAEKQGKDGIPKAPDTSTVAGEVPEPPPDSNAKSELQKEVQDADQTEQEVQSAGPGAQ